VRIKRQTDGGENSTVATSVTVGNRKDYNGVGRDNFSTLSRFEYVGKINANGTTDLDYLLNCCSNGVTMTYQCRRGEARI